MNLARRKAPRPLLIGVLQRSFNGKSSSARICSHLLCLQFCVIYMGNLLGQRSADKMAAYFFALEEIVVNLSLVCVSLFSLFLCP